MDLPVNVETGMVVGRYIVDVIDGADENREPDAQPVQGRIVFTSSVPYLPNPTAAPDPVTIMRAPIVGVLDADGYLCTPHPGTFEPQYRGVRLIATDDPDIAVTDWTWDVTYIFEPINGHKLAIPAHGFSLPSGGVVDLTKVAKVPSSPGYSLPQAEAAVLRAEEAALAGAADSLAARQAADRAEQAAAATDEGITSMLSDPDTQSGGLLADRLASKANADDVELSLSGKADKQSVDAALEDKAGKAETSASLQSKADLISGKVPVGQLPTDALVTDANVAAQINGTQTGTAIDARINNQVTSTVEPIVADYIASQPAVVDAAAAAVDANPKVAALEAKNVSQDTAIAAARWASTASLPSTTSFDSPLPFGQTSTASSANPGLPAAVIGSVSSEKVSAASLVTYKTWGTNPRLFMRSFATNGTPYAWREFAGLDTVTAVSARVTSLENAGATSETGSSGMKVVPLTMTAPGTPLSTTTDRGAVRWVRRYAVMPKRVRVHVANANTGNALKGDQSLSISHIRVGVGAADGGYTSGVIAQSGGTLVLDGSEAVTPWTTVPGLADGGYLAITVGWYGGGGTATLQNNQGGGWVTTDDALAGNPTTTGWTRSQTTPLHCWIEAEVPASTPVVLGNGDSITVGTATTDPVGDAWVAQYAYDNGALPVILAQHGSTMANWGSGSNRWKQYGTFDLNAVVDAIVTTLGQNDLGATGMDLATLKSRHTTFMAALRGIFPKQPVYLGAITPSNKNATLEQLRRDFNTWRAEPAQRERGVLDFATAVGGTADEDLLPEYSADGLHPNAAGQAVMAGVVEAVPVTPFTLSPAKLRALSAL